MKLIEFKGESKTLKEWAGEAGVNYHTLHGRLENGWTMEEAMAQKVDPVLSAAFSQGPNRKTKVEGERALNDLQLASLPPDLRKLIDHNARTTRYGTYLRTFCPKAFNKWFVEVYSK